MLDARPRRAGRRLRGREPRRRASLAVLARHQPRPPRAGARMSVASWLGRRRCSAALGAIARFLLDGAVPARLGPALPVRHARGQPERRVRARAARRRRRWRRRAAARRHRRLLGAFTTFSTWMLESHRLGEDGQLRLGALNFVVSLVLGVAARLGRTRARSGACERRLPQAHDLLRRARPRRRRLPRRRAHRRLRPPRARASLRAARRRGLRGQAARCAPTGCSRCRRTCRSSSVAVDTRAADRGGARRRRRRCRSTGWSRSSARGARAPVDAGRAARDRTRRRSSPSTSAARSARAAGPPTRRSSTLLHRHGVAGATVLLGVDGTAHGARRARALLRPQRRACR